MINRATKDQLISADSKNKEIIKTLLQGRNIRKWSYEESEIFLIFTRRGIDIKKFPTIEDYLSQFKEKLEPGKGRKPGSYNWFEIQDNTAYYSEFEKEKIIWGLTADKWAFAYDDKGHYLPSNGYILTSSEISVKYLLALLNSTLMEFYFRFIGIMTAGGAFTLKHETVKEFPIIGTSTQAQQPFINLVNQILDTKHTDPDADTSALEREVDQLVYALYDLTPEDIAIVEGKANQPKEEPLKDEPQEVKEKIEKFYKVRITKEQAAQGVRVAIPTGDGKKITVRLPASVSDGKQFRVKDRNLLVIASVEG